MQVEKKQDLFVLGLLSLLKSMPIRVDYIQEDSGEYAVFTTEGIITHGVGNTFEECQNDLVKDLKEFSQNYLENFSDWNSHNPDLLPYVLKYATCTPEELKSCLVGELSRDI